MTSHRTTGLQAVLVFRGNVFLIMQSWGYRTTLQ